MQIHTLLSLILRWNPTMTGLTFIEQSIWRCWHSNNYIYIDLEKSNKCNFFEWDQLHSMEINDNCPVCRIKMSRNPIMRLLNCRHIIHSKCAQRIIEDPNRKCPLCRSEITTYENILRKKFKQHTNEDRQRVVACANRGDDWVTLAKTLNINYKTAYHWYNPQKLPI